MLSLAATGYVLILTWNQDSQQEQKQVETNYYEEVQTLPRNQPLDALPIEHKQNHEIPDQSFLVTETEANLNTPSSYEAIRESRTDRVVRIDTPTLHIWVDRLGGDIVRINLPKYPRQIDIPDDTLFL